MQPSAFYQIRVRGYLGQEWSEWFGRITIAYESDGVTALTGALADQAALYGVLIRIRNLGLPLISVNVAHKLSEEKMDETKTYTVKEAHLHFAKSLNGRVWALLGKRDRTPDENETMLYAAHASCYHWLQVGTGVNHQRGEWLIARVYTVLGIADAAVRHATRCLELTHAFPDLMEDFDWAFAYEGVARANALAGNQATAREYIQRAEQSGHAIKDAEDKKIFFDDFNGGNWYNAK